MNTHLSTIARDAMRRERFEPVLLAEWSGVVFLHYAVDPQVLQPSVPYPLDLRDGLAYVSCVGFTMRDMRPRLGPAWLLRPIATHEFLNVRTYVKHGHETGIYFLAEWLPNQLSVLLGPTVFGLPYRHGTLSYRHRAVHGFEGHVEDTRSRGSLSYTAKPPRDTSLSLSCAEAGTLEEFLFERYSAFTMWCGLRRRFCVWHPAWQFASIDATVHDDSLLEDTGNWHREARFIGAHFAPGFKDIWMGRPRFIGKADSSFFQSPPHEEPSHPAPSPSHPQDCRPLLGGLCLDV